MEFGNLYTSAEVGENENISFAIFKDSNEHLLSVFDKSLTAISEKELNQIVVNNSISDERLSAIGFFYAYPAASLLSIFIFLVVLFASVAMVIFTRMKKKQLSLMLEKEENLNKIRSDFYTMMSHEIRTPLNAVMGYIRLAKENKSERTKLERYLRKSEYSATQLVAIVNDLLEINDIEKQGFELREEQFTLHESISLVTETIQIVAQNQGIDFTVSIKNQLYNYLVFDKKRLNQILLNLLENAIQNAQRESEVRLTIYEEEINSEVVNVAFNIQYKGIELPEDAIESLNKQEAINRNSVLNLDGMTAFTVLVSQFYTRLLGGEFQITQDEAGIAYHISFLIRIGHPKKITDIDKYAKVRALVATPDEETASYLKEHLKKYKIKSDIIKESDKVVKKIIMRKDTEYAYKICMIDDVFLEKKRELIREILDVEYAGDAPVVCILAQTGQAVPVNMLMEGVSKILCKPLQSERFDEKLEEILEDVNIDERKEIPQIHFPGVRVLLVEDNPVNADILKTTLNHIEIEVDIAQNGRIGVDKFEASKPGTYQIILMDIQMPIMNGYEATKAIRQSSHMEAKSIPIIAVSANAFAEDINNAKNAGMNEHVAKPVDYEKLNTILEKYIAD